MKFLLIAVAVPLASAEARATELCVKCTGPDSSYACIVGSAHSSNATLDTVAKFYCIKTLAKSGKHTSCAIDRAAAAPCPGERKELPIPAFINDAIGDDPQPQDASLPKQDPAHPGLQTGAEPPAANVTSEPPQNSAPPSEAANDAPPKTVQEMVEKSAKSAGDGLSETQKTAGDAAKSASTALEKAGSAVGGAAKSSWKCLSSFFSNC